MANKQQVIALHLNDPTMTSKQIASAILGASAKDYERVVKTDGWVRAVARREGLKLAKVVPKPKIPKELRPDGLMALGLACRRAGLTITDILDIAETINA